MDPCDQLALLLGATKRKLQKIGSLGDQFRRCESKTASISPNQVKRHLPSHYENGCYPVFNFLQEWEAKYVQKAE